ncbi:MAG: hypothetical protein ABEJ31_07125 [Haloarculaceae archaeon]
MPDTLPVHVNRRERNSLEVPPSFETDDSFVIAVENHGEAGRVHVHLDDGLSEWASVDANNYYVEANAIKEIPVSVTEPGPGFGKLKVVSGYGATTRWIDVELAEADDGPDGVVIDEDLAKPRPDDGAEPGGPLVQRLAASPAAPVVALGALALVVAVGAALAFQSGLVAAAAVIVVLAVVAAGYFAVR